MIYQKPSGLWYCVYYDGPKRKWEAYGRGPEGKAAAKLRDMEIRFKKERGQFHNAPHLITFHQLAQAYINDKDRLLSKHTMDGILRALKLYAIPVIGKTPINLLNIDHWRLIQKKMFDRNLKNRTINTYYKYISGVLTWAVDENDILEVHPWRKRKTLPEEKYRIDLFTLEEFLRIMAVSASHLAWILELAYYTGARPGPKELFSLTWDRIDSKRNAILIDCAKRNSPNAEINRWQYLPPGYIRRLKRYQAWTQKKYPGCSHICHYEGRPIRSIKTAFAHAKKRARITRTLRPYDIRHYHITYALAGGADIRELAERVGHSTPRMIVNTYSHLAKDILKKDPHTLPELRQNTPTVDNSRQTVDKNKKAANKKAAQMLDFI